MPGAKRQDWPTLVQVVTGSVLFVPLPELGGQPCNASTAGIRNARMRAMYPRTELSMTGRELETDRDIASGPHGAHRHARHQDGSAVRSARGRRAPVPRPGGHEAVADRLTAEGIDVVQDRCLLMEHRRWLARW